MRSLKPWTAESKEPPADNRLCLNLFRRDSDDAPDPNLLEGNVTIYADSYRRSLNSVVSEHITIFLIISCSLLMNAVFSTTKIVLMDRSICSKIWISISF